jgi:hypothetical protein
MADDPKPATAADLKALADRVKALESVKVVDYADRLKGISAALAELAARIDKLEAKPAATKAAPVHPWRHRENGQGARIFEQGTETSFQLEGEGDVLTLPTHEFNARYEDATQAG